MCQDQRSKCQKLQITSSVIITDILMKLQQFLTNNLWVACYRFFTAVTLTWTHDIETEMCVSIPKMKLLGKAIHKVYSELKKYDFSSQGQRSNVTNFQTLLAFPMGYIPTKLHQFLTSSFWDFLQTDAQTHRQTAKNNTCSQHTWYTGNNLRWPIRSVILSYRKVVTGLHTEVSTIWLVQATYSYVY